MAERNRELAIEIGQVPKLGDIFIAQGPEKQKITFEVKSIEEEFTGIYLIVVNTRLRKIFHGGKPLTFRNESDIDWNAFKLLAQRSNSIVHGSDLASMARRLGANGRFPGKDVINVLRKKLGTKHSEHNLLESVNPGVAGEYDYRMNADVHFTEKKNLIEVYKELLDKTRKEWYTISSKLARFFVGENMNQERESLSEIQTLRDQAESLSSAASFWEETSRTLGTQQGPTYLNYAQSSGLERLGRIKVAARLREVIGTTTIPYYRDKVSEISQQIEQLERKSSILKAQEELLEIRRLSTEGFATPEMLDDAEREYEALTVSFFSLTSPQEIEPMVPAPEQPPFTPVEVTPEIPVEPVAPMELFEQARQIEVIRQNLGNASVFDFPAGMTIHDLFDDNPYGRTANVLMRSGRMLVERVLSSPVRELLGIRLLGEKSLVELLVKLQEKGILPRTLAPVEQEQPPVTPVEITPQVPVEQIPDEEIHGRIIESFDESKFAEPTPELENIFTLPDGQKVNNLTKQERQFVEFLKMLLEDKGLEEPLPKTAPFKSVIRDLWFGDVDELGEDDIKVAKKRLSVLKTLLNKKLAGKGWKVALVNNFIFEQAQEFINPPRLGESTYYTLRKIEETKSAKAENEVSFEQAKTYIENIKDLFERGVIISPEHLQRVQEIAERFGIRFELKSSSADNEELEGEIKFDEAEKAILARFIEDLNREETKISDEIKFKLTFEEGTINGCKRLVEQFYSNNPEHINGELKVARVQIIEKLEKLFNDPKAEDRVLEYSGDFGMLLAELLIVDQGVSPTYFTEFLKTRVKGGKYSDEVGLWVRHIRDAQENKPGASGSASAETGELPVSFEIIDESISEPVESQPKISRVREETFLVVSMFLDLNGELTRKEVIDAMGKTKSGRDFTWIQAINSMVRMVGVLNDRFSKNIATTEEINVLLKIREFVGKKDEDDVKQVMLAWKDELTKWFKENSSETNLDPEQSNTKLENINEESKAPAGLTFRRLSSEDLAVSSTPSRGKKKAQERPMQRTMDSREVIRYAESKGFRVTDGGSDLKIVDQTGTYITPIPGHHGGRDLNRRTYLRIIKYIDQRAKEIEERGNQ